MILESDYLPVNALLVCFVRYPIGGQQGARETQVGKFFKRSTSLPHPGQQKILCSCPRSLLSLSKKVGQQLRMLRGTLMKYKTQTSVIVEKTSKEKNGTHWISMTQLHRLDDHQNQRTPYLFFFFCFVSTAFF